MKRERINPANGDNLLDVIAESLEEGADVERRPFADEDTHTYFVTGER